MNSKEPDGALLSSPSPRSPECCMCGDYGLPSELFRCRSCLFRSQHRYCSNLYPKAESYRVCNWCLKQGEKIEGLTHNSSLSSSNSDVNTSEDGDKRKIRRSSSGVNHHKVGDLKIQRSTSQLHLKSPTKKLKFSDQVLSGQKKNISVASSGGRKESLRRTKSEDIANERIVKQAVKGKVRRYKLLQEVSIR